MQFWGKKFQEQISGMNFREPVPEVWGTVPEISGISFLVSCVSYFSYFSGFWLLAFLVSGFWSLVFGFRSDVEFPRSQKPEK